MGLMNDWSDVVLDLHESGQSRAEITAQLPISSWSVSKIVAGAGRTFAGTSQSENARAHRITKQYEARRAEAMRLLPLVEQAFAAGNTAVALQLSDTIHELLGFSPVEALLGLEKDPNWINRALGPTHHLIVPEKQTQGLRAWPEPQLQASPLMQSCGQNRSR